MKLFRSHQVVPLLILFFCCLVASNAVFDRISNGAPYKESVRTCSSLNQLFTSGASHCHNATYTFQDFGWPFQVTRRADSAVPLEFRNNSFSIEDTDTVYVSLNTVVLFLAVAAAYLLMSRYLWGRFAFTHPIDFPVIQSSDMLETVGLTSMARGQLVGYDYNLLINGNGRVMLNVTLGNNTGIHVVATGSKSISSQPFSERIESRFLKPVTLEGDFPEHFELYCTPGKERELLQIFDPATMARLIDFCKAYELEIFHDTLHIAQAQNADDKEDQTTMLADAETLLTKCGDTFSRLKA